MLKVPLRKSFDEKRFGQLFLVRKKQSYFLLKKQQSIITWKYSLSSGILSGKIEMLI